MRRLQTHPCLCTDLTNVVVFSLVPRLRERRESTFFPCSLGIRLVVLLTCYPPAIVVIEHLEFNVVPLAVSLTSKFYQTMQDFFFPKAEGEGQGQGEVAESDHTHLFGPGGVQRT